MALSTTRVSQSSIERIATGTPDSKFQIHDSALSIFSFIFRQIASHKLDVLETPCNFKLNHYQKFRRIALDLKGPTRFVFQASRFRLNNCKIPPRFLLPFPKWNCRAKIIHAHSLRLLEIAPNPCYKKLHPKYPNNIFVPRQKGPERTCVSSLPSLPAVAGRGGPWRAVT
jgi:hypothetical protein